MTPRREPPAVAAWYEMMLWALPVMGRLPRSHRYTLGEMAERMLVETLDLLLKAQYRKANLRLLEEANQRVDVVRYLVRLLHDLRMIPTEQYGKFCERLLSVGRQIGGWKKTTSGTDS